MLSRRSAPGLILITLVVLSLLSLVFEEVLLVKTLRVSPKSFSTVELYNDSLYGGSSKVKRVQDPDAYVWECELVFHEYEFPYCGFEIFLGENRSKGLNLSEFDRVFLKLFYEGEARTVRVFIRNFNEAYSNTRDKTSTKFNVLELDRHQMSKNGAEVGLDAFSVAPWWLRENNIPQDLMGPEFDNVVIIEIQTGSEEKQGTHKYALEYIEFSGRRISHEHWLMLLVSIWIVIATVVAIDLLRKSSD